MLVKPVKFGRRARKSGNIPCTHIAVQENLAEDGVTLMSVVIEICGGPPGIERRVHMPDDADEFYVMDDRGDHQDSYKWKRMLESSMYARQQRSRPTAAAGAAAFDRDREVRS